MRVLYCIDNLSIGGAERVGVDICNLIDNEEEFSVQLLLMRKGGILENALNPSIPVKKLDFHRKTSLTGWIRLVKELRGFDLIHVHMRHTYGRVKLAAMLSGLRTPIILHDHFGDIEFNKKAPVYLVNLFKPRHYIGVSEMLTTWSKEVLKLELSQIWKLPNTIVRDEPPNRKRCKKKDLVVVSNLRRTKNIEFAIQIAKKTGLKLDIYGCIIDVEYFRFLKDLSLGYPINFINDVDDVFPYLSDYQLALHPAKSETGPLVIMEYLKSGTNFIAFDTGEVVRQIIREFPDNILSDFSEEKWIYKVQECIRNPIPEERLKASFNSLFSPSMYVTKLLKIYTWIKEH